MPGRTRLAASVLAALALATAPAAAARDLLVFAAASLQTALDPVAAGWAEATGTAVAVSYGGSAALARQIRQGAPADVFLSAHPDWMDALEREGLIDPATRRDLLGNRLVLIAHDRAAAAVEIGPGLDLAARLGEGRLAMGLVDAVPAGVYGKAALQALGAWEGVADRLAQTDSVRAALALVARGEAPYGIVYATDATAEDDVTVVGTFPAESHPPIVYPGAVLPGGGHGGARGFLDHLRSDAARAAFERQGFEVPP